MIILGLAVSFKTMNRLDPTVTLFDGLFFKKAGKMEINLYDHFRTSCII